MINITPVFQSHSRHKVRNYITHFSNQFTYMYTDWLYTGPCSCTQHQELNTGMFSQSRFHKVIYIYIALLLTYQATAFVQSSKRVSRARVALPHVAVLKYNPQGVVINKKRTQYSSKYLDIAFSHTYRNIRHQGQHSSRMEQEDDVQQNVPLQQNQQRRHRSGPQPKQLQQA